MARLISDKGDFRTRNITSKKEILCKMIKGSMQQEDTTVLNRCVPSNRVSKYMKPKELKGDIHKSTNTVGGFNISLSNRIS